ncbi:MAG: alpha/beta hydrolase [Polaromonas sp.]|nr:MAG: alpha/beta hydrolase [Polaromonas sp.]
MPNAPLVIFSHGKETGPWGTKIRRLADVAQAAGWQVISVDYAALTGQVDAPAELRLQALLHLLATGLPPHSQLALVGSSMGGWVSAQAACHVRPAGLFLLAPALGIASYPSQWPAVDSSVDIEITHGWADDVIPAQNSITFAQRTGARLHVVADDHRLSQSLDVLCASFAAFLARVKGAAA